MRYVNFRAVGPVVGTRPTIQCFIAGVVLAIGFSIASCERKPNRIAAANQALSPRSPVLRELPAPECDLGAVQNVNRPDDWSPYDGNAQDKNQVSGEHTASLPKKDTDQVDLLAQERDCYRQAALQALRRLHKLQSIVLQSSPTHPARNSR